MAEHRNTPAPWVRGDPENQDSLATVLTPDGALVIAEVFYAEGYGTREEAEADLALVLAAPVLADALELFIRCGEALLAFAIDDQLDDGEHAKMLRAHIDSARATLRAAGRLP